MQSQLHRYATDPREGDCLRLLPYVSPGRALFFGNALAILPFLLAKHFDSVVTAEPDERRIGLALRRQQVEDVSNMVCMTASSPEEVAGRHGLFDLVVLGDDDPDAPVSLPLADAAMAGRLASVSAGGGCLMYGVRGRRWWPRARYPAQRRLLERVGFRVVQGYARQPGRRPYQLYLPLDDSRVLDYWLRNGRRPEGLRSRGTRLAKQAAIRLGTVSALFENFVVIASRE